MPKPPKAPRVPKAEAIVRFVDAVIFHVRSIPPAEISDQLVADTAGINRALLYRYFGTRFGLFEAVVDELVRRWLELAKTTIPVARTEDRRALNLESMVPMFELSRDLFALGNYLVAENSLSPELKQNFSAICDGWAAQYEAVGIGPRMARALALKTLTLNLGRSPARSLVDYSDQEALDVVELAISEIRNTVAMQSDLGWDQDPR